MIDAMAGLLVSHALSNANFDLLDKGRLDDGMTRFAQGFSPRRVAESSESGPENL